MQIELNRKKRILIVNNNMCIGGVQKALLNLLRAISSDYEIDLLLFNASGDYMPHIPQNVRVIKTSSWYRYLGFSQKECKSSKDRIVRGVLSVVAKFAGNFMSLGIVATTQRALDCEYDIAISFLHGGNEKVFYGGCNEFVIKHVTAKKKLTWLHCDFAVSGSNNNYNKRLYAKFDKIVACSEGCRRAFVECLPEFSSKTVSIRNCNDYDAIRVLAGDGVRYDKENFNVVTVARLSAEKGIDRAIKAVSACLAAGYSIKYHIVGAGKEESALKSLVSELGMEEQVVFYGNQANPYPYIKNADLFLLSSYHEAAPMVFDESACLGVPVLATETTSTSDMIVARQAGVVCDNTQEGITDALLGILSDREVLHRIGDGLKNIEFDNSDAVSRFRSLIE